MTQGEDLRREIAETRAALTKLLAKMQEYIDIIKGNPDDSAAVTEAITALDSLQTEMLAAADPTPPADPNA